MINQNEWFKQSGLNSLKSKIDELDIGKLKTTPTDLSRLNNVVKINLLKRLNVINWLKKLTLLILVNLLTKQIVMLRSKIL